MKFPLRSIAISFLFCWSCDVFAQQAIASKETDYPAKLIFETSLGIGAVNNKPVQSSFSLRSGFDNYFLTARFIRSDAGNSIYENCWLAGYRFNFWKTFNSTISIGAGDIAFVKGYSRRENRISETLGLTFDAEFQWKIQRNKVPTSWAMFANYHTTFNKINNLNGLTAGFSFSPRAGLFSPRKEVRGKFAEALAIERKERKRLHRIKKAGRIEHENKFHWENQVMFGYAEHDVVANFSSFIGLNGIMAGCIFRGGMFDEYKVQVPYGPPAPPNFMVWEQIHAKSYEWNPAIAYNVLKKESTRLWLYAGPALRTTNKFMFDNSNFRPHWYPRGSEYRTGCSVQIEADFIGKRKLAGIGFYSYVSVYRDYKAIGVGGTFKFGVLR